MAATTQMTRAQMEARIAELAATPDEMVATDEGTHGYPAKHYVYERLDGTRYGKRDFTGAISYITEAECEERTDGRMRHLGPNQSAIRAAARELRELRAAVRSAR